MGKNVELSVAIIKSGRTKREIAWASKIREPRFSSITNGWIEPRPAERAAIADALGLPEAELFASDAAPVGIAQ